HNDDDTIDSNAPRMPRVTIEDAPTSTLERSSGSTVDRSSSAAPEREDDPAFQNIFLNVGRRDGLRADDVQRLIVDLGGVSTNDVGHIRLRDRMTFVGVRKELAERVIKALIGQTVGTRTLNAEPARRTE